MPKDKDKHDMYRYDVRTPTPQNRRQAGPPAAAWPCGLTRPFFRIASRGPP